MTNEMALRNLSNNFAKLDPKLQKATINHISAIVAENLKYKEEIENIDKKYDKTMSALSNRCFTLTAGAMCLFCSIECKYRKIAYRDESIDPLKLMDIKPSEVDEALKNGSLLKDNYKSSSTYTVNTKEN